MNIRVVIQTVQNCPTRPQYASPRSVQASGACIARLSASPAPAVGGVKSASRPTVAARELCQAAKSAAPAFDATRRECAFDGPGPASPCYALAVHRRSIGVPLWFVFGILGAWIATSKGRGGCSGFSCARCWGRSACSSRRSRRAWIDNGKRQRRTSRGGLLGRGSDGKHERLARTISRRRTTCGLQACHVVGRSRQGYAPEAHHRDVEHSRRWHHRSRHEGDRHGRASTRSHSPTNSLRHLIQHRGRLRQRLRTARCSCWRVCREVIEGHKVITLRVAEFDQTPNVCTRLRPERLLQARTNPDPHERRTESRDRERLR